MEVQRRNSDRISALPQETIDKILSLMPIRDALRTSILSRKWRYHWRSMPILVFDDNLLNTSSTSEEIYRYMIVNAIFHVLLLHRGPILQFGLSIWETTVCNNELDMIILHLSRSNDMKKFVFFSTTFYYKLPYAFFSLQGLEHIGLSCCAFKPPLTFNGFGKLRILRFVDVDITAITFQRLLTTCPLLEEVCLIAHAICFEGEGNCTFVELFKCLPLVQYLKISKLYMENFAAGGYLQELPSSLVHLRILDFDVCFGNKDEFLSALWLISSSPNLEKIKMMCCGHTFQQRFSIPFDLHSLKLDHLKELEITSFHNNTPEMEFVKLIMAKSSKLKQVRLELGREVSADKEVEMLRYLLRVPFPRASATASIIIERP